MGLPVVVTNTSGPAAFCGENNSFLIRCDGGAEERSGLARPSVAHLRRLMRRVFEGRAEAAERGRRARATVEEGYSPAAVGAAGYTPEEVGAVLAELKAAQTLAAKAQSDRDMAR